MSKPLSLLAGAAALAIVVAPIGAAYAQMGADAIAIGNGGPVQPGLGTGGAGGEGDASNGPGSRAGSEPASRISTVGQCNTNKTRFRTETDVESTTSTTFVNMPSSHRVIPVGANGCIIVTVTGEFSSQTDNIILVRAGIQGGPIAEPSSMWIGQPAATTYSARTLQFVFTNLPAGNHTVRLFYASGNGTEVIARKRMIKYEYR